MVPGSKVKLHVQCGSEGSEEVGNEFRSAIGSDVAWNTMLGKRTCRTKVVQVVEM